MTLTFCPPRGALVKPQIWLPVEPFDYAWAQFGCNQLGCGACGQRVRSSVDHARHCRHYECACQSRDEYGFHLLGADDGRDRAFESAWRCGGHPPLMLPTTLDGVAVPARDSFDEVVARTLLDPPFVAPGFESSEFWIVRLHHLVPEADQKSAIGRAVAARLSGEDPRLVEAAIGFFFLSPEAAGAERLAEVAASQRLHLLSTPAPGDPEFSLYDRFLEAIGARLTLPVDVQKVDEPALDVARGALLRGEAAEEMIFAVADHDPQWLVDHVVEIVRSQRDMVGYILESLVDLAPDQRSTAMAAMSRIDRKTAAAVKRWAEDNGAA